MNLQESANFNSRTEVVILGAGPAGATTALLLARSGISVHMIERAETALWKIGEGLPPVAKTLLLKLGLWQRFMEDEHLPSHANRSAWGTPEISEQNFIFNPYGSAWHLDRSRFDAMLIRAALEAGARLARPAHLVDYRRTPNQTWQLQLVAEGRPMIIESNFVVDASGRSSWFALRQGAKRQRLDNLIGIVALLQPQISFTDSTTLIEAAQHGWWYSALLPCKKIVVAFMSDADTIAARELSNPQGFRTLLQHSPHTCERVEAAQCSFTQSPRIVSANSSCLKKMAGDGWLAAGDAAAAFDPLSSQGILTALASGIYAATVIQARREGNLQAVAAYAAQLQRAFQEYAKNRVAYYTVEKRWTDSLFWRRRRQHDSQIFLTETLPAAALSE
ncbi:MAG: tryptophan 7-halogenase [Acidobacteria bacterium]|nr:tryptophan 7-halogenase [Acidobacteriota bacterium]